ncbi:serine protease lint [Bombyx mandarina]|uniref:Serine protease lint n=1 Tax=Bombyx mandarina TaxID=7092 RepID=A0A6J2JHG4_BOMMA|nr:serine protease lint [Bombyx mandarina]
MTVRKWFKTGGDVKHLFFILVLLSIVDDLSYMCRGENYDRDSRKLFGGYRITPMYCKASRVAKYNRGKTICMFNHECGQRGGEVVGACMDGFLFGACCQLKSDSQSHIPKGPGVVMTSYLDYPDADSTEDYDVEQINAWHNSFKPVVTPGYRPADKTTTTKPVEEETQSVSAEILSEGLTQITNTLLSTPPKDSSFVYVKPKPDYTYSGIDHSVPETILVHTNGSIVDDVARPSDFNVQVSSMQTKPTASPTTSSTASPMTISTHRPVFSKPVFRPKPTTTTENYIMISTIMKESTKPELTSINTIINMLNDSTPNFNDDATRAPIEDVLETKSSPTPIGTVSSASFSTNHYPTSGHYVTLKPSSYSSTYSQTNGISTNRPQTNKLPSYTTANTIQDDEKTSTKPYVSLNPSSQAIDAFNRYPTDPNDFGDKVTTFAYFSTTTTTKPTTTSRRPPSTSYVIGTQPSRRPTPMPGYASAPDSFSSVTPTVIVLNGFQTPEPEKEPEFVEISQEPFKKPVSQITVNNHIESTNNIYMGKPPQTFEKPSSPTIVITPKPVPNTTPYPVKAATKPFFTTAAFETESPTTYKPELQTSPDDLINFPPVRNPMLNATGSNTALYNTSISLADNELDILHDIDFTTPTWKEDEKFKDKMNIFVSKIVGSLQGTFQELHDIVILDKKPNLTTTTQKPKKTLATTKKPLVTTRKPVRLTPTTRRPTTRTTKKPTKLTTAARRTTTTAAPTTTVASTKKPVTTTKKTKPTKKATTTVAPTSTVDYDDVTVENLADQVVDYNDKNLCGVRPLSKSGRIVGGKNAHFGDWPWQVLVREATWLGLFVKNKCGGVLITSRFVTTAAHCQPGFLASLVAVFGENDISGDKEPKIPVTRNVRRVIVHRQYDPATFENDLAILELETPIKFDSHIVPICLPPDDADFTGRVATVTGWGRIKYGGGIPAVLQEVQVPVIENSACQEMFHTAGHDKVIKSSFLCAGYANGQKDSCEGDSGGPLVLQRDDGRWQLVGTVSHGIKCAAPFLPGVYMRTTFYKPWLKSITAVKG